MVRIQIDAIDEIVEIDTWKWGVDRLPTSYLQNVRLSLEPASFAEVTTGGDGAVHYHESRGAAAGSRGLLKHVAVVGDADDIGALAAAASEGFIDVWWGAVLLHPWMSVWSEWCGWLCWWRW